MAVPSPLGTRPTVAALLALTVVTGLVDAVSYLRLGRVFVANMTGNVVFLGFTANPHSGLSPAASLIAIAGFVLGALAAGRAAHSLSSRPGPWLATAFTTEAIILTWVAVFAGAGVLPYTGHGGYVTIVLLASALGLQNGTVRHFGVPDLTTTVLTLSLTGLTADSSLAGGSGAKPLRRLGSICAMLAGAAAGAALLQTSPSAVIAIAATLTALVAALFTWTELSGRFAGTDVRDPRPTGSGTAATSKRPASQLECVSRLRTTRVRWAPTAIGESAHAVQPHSSARTVEPTPSRKRLTPGARDHRQPPRPA